MHAHRLWKKLVPYWTFYRARGTIEFPFFLEKIMEISWIFHGENVEIYGGFMEILCAFDGKAMEI